MESANERMWLRTKARIEGNEGGLRELEREVRELEKEERQLERKRKKGLKRWDILAKVLEDAEEGGRAGETSRGAKEDWCSMGLEDD